MSWRGTSGHCKARWTGCKPDSSYEGLAGKFRKTDHACLDLLEFPLQFIDFSPFLGTREGGSDTPE
jgi:hypothetical protein